MFWMIFGGMCKECILESDLGLMLLIVFFVFWMSGLILDNLILMVFFFFFSLRDFFFCFCLSVFILFLDLLVCFVERIIKSKFLNFGKRRCIIDFKFVNIYYVIVING